MRFRRTAARKRAVLLLASLLAAGCSAASPPNAATPESGLQHVVVFSDLHFDPFYDPALVDSLAAADVSLWPQIFARSGVTSYSPLGKDINYPLLQSALTAMHQAAPAAPLVLFAGDFMGHNFQKEYKASARDTSAQALARFTAKTAQFVAQQIAAAFPDAQVLPALGNNDADCGDYMSEPGGAFLRSVGDAWNPLVNRHGDAPQFRELFAVAGHYTARAPVIRARVVVMNDVYWTPKYRNACGSPTADPAQDAVSWLRRVLEESRARHEPVWLLMHVPVGVDVYATLHSKDSALVTMLQPARAADFLSLLREFSSTVRYSLYGHTHMNEFRAPGGGEGAVTVGSKGFPAVSGIYNNNPSFAVLSVDGRTGVIGDYTMHVLTNLAQASVAAPGIWAEEYDFAKTYGIAGLSASSLGRLWASLATDSVARASFLRYYDSGTGHASPNASSWRAYWCGIGYMDPAAFERCNRGN